MVDSHERIMRVTKELSEELKRELPQDPYRCDYLDLTNADTHNSTWSVRIERTFDSKRLGIKMNQDVTVGRSPEDCDFVLFDPNDAEHLGVSRCHAMLRPTEDHIYLLDVGSTNGSFLNGQAIGVNMPYALSHGDRVTLGRLEFIFHIDERPSAEQGQKEAIDDWSLQSSIARAILSSLKQTDIFKLALLEMTRFINATEVIVWLVDSQTGELYMEVGDGTIAAPLRLPTEDSLAGKALEAKKTLTINREQGGRQIKLKTDYLVEAVIYVPIIVGDIAIGVMSAVNREQGELFTKEETRIAQTIADYTAIALQNARQYEASREEIERRSRIISALNDLLKSDCKQQVNSILGYSSLLAENLSNDADNSEMLNTIATRAFDVNQILDAMILLTSLQQNPEYNSGLCDLVGMMEQIIDGMVLENSALKSRLKLQVMGKIQFIEGNPALLQRCFRTLILYTLQRSELPIHIALVFWDAHIILRVRDNGKKINMSGEDYLLWVDQSGKPDPVMHVQLELLRQIVINHRGSFHINNLDGQGVEFIIKLPITLQMSKNNKE